MTEPPVPRFIGAFPRADTVLDPPLPEVAFIGRSNVGKSSLLNALVGRRIAKISATPGKTRTMNVFQIPGTWGRGEVGPLDATGSPVPIRQVPHPHAPTSPDFYLLDLPGYGYARVSQVERAQFAQLVRHVLSRPKLAGVVWLLDIRHEPSKGDHEMQDLLAGTAARVLAAVTKSDKLSRAERLAHTTALRRALGLDEDQVVVTSARTKDGMGDLRDAVLGLVAAG